MTPSNDIPLLDLKPQYAVIKDAVEPRLLALFESQHFIMGPDVAEFEREMSAYCRVSHSVGVSSGTDALLLALMTLELKPGEEVVTTPYSFFATAGSIARLGLKPIFVDIDPETFNIDTRLLESALSSRTRAIIPVHLFGQCCDMDPILELAKRRGLSVIEDAAQAIGAEYRGIRAGAMGTFGAFSFFPSKNLGCFGDAGLVTTGDPALYERLKTLRVHGSKVKYFHELVGGNFRIDTLQCIVLREKLKHLDRWRDGRRANAASYRRFFEASGVLSARTESGRPVIELPAEAENMLHVFNQFVIRTPYRDFLREALGQRKIGCEVYYPVPLHLQRCFEHLGYRPGSFPESERAAKETLALPIFPELGAERVAAVATAVVEALCRASGFRVPAPAAS